MSMTHPRGFFGARLVRVTIRSLMTYSYDVTRTGGFYQVKVLVRNVGVLFFRNSDPNVLKKMAD